jgi:prepilin-type N-terminal cleavage/methylation domain-containing protein
MLPGLKQKGVTFIELMIAVVIIGIVAAMTIGQFDRFIQRQRLKAEGRDLISNLRLARSYAVARNDQFGIYFDVNNRQYVLFKDLENLSSYTYDSGDSVIKTKPLSDIFSFSLSFPNNVVVYLPNGSASSSGQVYLCNTQISKYLTADVLGSTGRVRLTEGYGG